MGGLTGIATQRCVAWNNHIILGLAAIGDSWVNLFSKNVTKKQIQFHGDYDAGDLFEHPFNHCVYGENHFGFDLFYGALHRYLHNYDVADEPSLDICRMQNIMNSAPFGGPYYHALTAPPDHKSCSLSSKDIAPDGWGSSLRFSVAPDPFASPQEDGNCGERGNYSGLDYMLFHNLYYLLNTQSKNFSGNFPAFNFPNNPAHECESYLGGLPPIGSTLFPKFFTNPTKHIDVNNLNVTNLTEHCLGHEETFDGYVRITGGPSGVTLNNTQVNNGGRLYVSCIVGCGVNPGEYLFLPSAYMKLGQNEVLPPYVISEEFKQLETDKILISPNPNNGTFMLQMENEGNSYNIFIYNSLGEVVHKQILNSSTAQIDLTSQPHGIYIIKAENENNVYMKKVVVR